MLEEIPVGIWWEWCAFAGIEVFGSEADFLKAGIIASTVANTARNPKKKAKPYQPSDFMPKFHKPKPQTPEEMLRIVEMLNTAWGGRDLRGQKKEGSK
jgi:hypothetical protein